MRLDLELLSIRLRELSYSLLASRSMAKISEYNSTILLSSAKGTDAIPEEDTGGHSLGLWPVLL